MALGLALMFRSEIFPAKFLEKCFFSMGYGPSVSHAKHDISDTVSQVKQPLTANRAKHLAGFAAKFSSKISELSFEINKVEAKCFACETRQHGLRFAARAALTPAQPAPATLPAFRERTSHGQA